MSGPEQLVARCAALLRGGVPTDGVFAAIAAETRDPDAVAIAERVAAGARVLAAVADQDRPEWRVLAAAWRLAEQSGAPLAPAIDRIAEALGQLARLREHRSVLLSGPRATVRMVIALPPLALLLGALLGFDPVPVLLSPIGAAALCAGALLLGLGMLWARSIVGQVDRSDRVAGIENELVWIAMRGGAAPSVALVRAADSVDLMRAEWVGFAGFLADAPLRTALAAAAQVGVPVGSLLLEEARAARLRAHAELEREAEKLAVRILLPLGLCVLPAFVMIGVLPVLLSMLGGI